MNSTPDETSTSGQLSGLNSARADYATPRGRIVNRILSVALLCSFAIIVWGMTHYRIPGKLWRTLDRTQNPVPEIPIALAYRIPIPEPSLSFESRGSAAIAEWQTVARSKLRMLLGVTEQAHTPAVRKIREDARDKVIRETLVLTAADGQELPAFLLRPAVNGKRRAAVLVIPGHSRGIVNTAGIIDDYHHANGLALARAGYVVLTVEVRGFGYLARMGAAPESVDLASHVAWAAMTGATAIGITVDDARSGLSYLESRSDVDPARLGVVGFSSGGKAAIYLAAIDDRVRAAVVSGCVSGHAANFRYSKHDSYEAVPGLASFLALSDCIGLFAPRPMLVHWGERDTDTQARCAAFNASSLPEFEAAQRIYDVAGAAQSLEKHITPDLGHEFDKAAAIAFLTRHLPPTMGQPE